MEKGTRLYINITNKCNLNCPFCCMYSGTDKNTFMNFDTFKNIIDKTKGIFELQLEGGEPTLHKDLFLFMEYAISTERCKKIILLTNGLLIDKYIKPLVNIHKWYSIPIDVKISINYFILQNTTDQLKKLDYILFSVKFIDNFNIIFNVRKRINDDFVAEELLKKYKLYESSNIYYFQSYGKLEGSTYDKPVIVQNIENWILYSCDGHSFSNDLIARSEYEKTLQ